jgi:hypothetical protein
LELDGVPLAGPEGTVFKGLLSAGSSLGASFFGASTGEKPISSSIWTSQKKKLHQWRGKQVQANLEYIKSAGFFNKHGKSFFLRDSITVRVSLINVQE